MQSDSIIVYMKNYILALIFILSFPVWAGISPSYTPACFIKPCEIKGDFDGDGKPDRAILVQSKDGKKGVQFRFANGKNKVIGAGNKTGNGGDDFSWLDHWELHTGPIEQGADAKSPPKVKGDTLKLEKTESASGIVYWNGTGFKWYQQGD